jgi:hypothetical protein
MTTDVVPAAIVPPHPAWRSLLWTIPFAILWTWLIYSLPMFLESGFPALAVRLMVHGRIALGLWLALERTDLTPAQRRTTWSHPRFGLQSPGQRPSMVSSARAPPPCRCCHSRSSCR